MRKIIFIISILGLLSAFGCTKKSSPGSLQNRTLEGSITDGYGIFEKDIGSNFTVSFSSNDFIIDGDPENKGTFSYKQLAGNHAILVLKHEKKGANNDTLKVDLAFQTGDSGSYEATLEKDDKSRQKGNFRLK